MPIRIAKSALGVDMAVELEPEWHPIQVCIEHAPILHEQVLGVGLLHLVGQLRVEGDALGAVIGNPRPQQHGIDGVVVAKLLPLHRIARIGGGAQRAGGPAAGESLGLGAALAGQPRAMAPLLHRMRQFVPQHGGMGRPVAEENLAPDR